MSEAVVDPLPQAKNPPSPYRLDAAAVEAALRECHGNLAEVGRRLGFTRQGVSKFIRERPELLAVAAETRETMLDVGERSLFKAVQEGQAWAVCFFLKTQGRRRGYVERQELRLGQDAEAGPVRVALSAEQFQALPLADAVREFHKELGYEGGGQ